MRGRSSRWVHAAVAVAAVTMAAGIGAAAPTPAAPIPAAAEEVSPGVHDVLADAPTDLSVTVYRSSYREAGGMDLDDLEGFALVRETRTVRVPAGESRIRFQGVADGIEPVSAIITGFPDGIIEKNRDAHLLSPAALMAAAVGKPVMLVRSNSKTGNAERVPGTILADADGVVFKTESGVEALRCSGLSESFTFTGVTGLAATPTLSVLVRTTQPMMKTVTLAYLARGFDWSADYSATLSADGSTIDLGAWVTLANGNGVGFPQAHTQVVAGRLNRESDEVEPIDIGGPVLATCWPRGSTSDVPQYLQLSFPRSLAEAMRKSDAFFSAAAPAALQEVMVTGARVTQEQLGDLKLYRVPHTTTVASRQSKQVRLLDRAAIPVRRVYSWTLSKDADEALHPASVLLRTRNNTANHLGLPLPSGRVAVFAPRKDSRLLLNEANLRDLAVNEEVEIEMGASSDVQVKAVEEKESIDPGKVKLIPFVPGVSLRDVEESGVMRVEVSNARAVDVDFELTLALPAEIRVVRADHPLGRKNGRPLFRLRIPANKTVTVRFLTATDKAHRQ